MPKLRVVFSIGALHGGGSERQIVAILRHLDRDRFEPFLYLVSRQGPLLNEVPDDVPIAAFEERCAGSRIYIPGAMHNRRVVDMHAFLHEVRADVSYDRTFLMTLIAADAAQRAGIPNISTIVTDPIRGFGPVAGRFQWIKKRRLSRLYQHSSRVLAVSEGAGKSAEQFYRLRKGTVQTLQNGVDFHRMRSAAEVPPDDDWWTGQAHDGRRVVRLAAAGRLNREKGFHLLIEAIGRLVIANPDMDLRLVILGEGPGRSVLEDHIRARNLSRTVRLPGFCRDAPSWFRTADLFVLSSLLEGMPNVLLEAMACGTSVLSTDCPSGPAEILQEGKYGELCEPGTVEGLQHGIQKFIDNPEAARDRSKAAGEYIEREFSVVVATRRLESIFQEVHSGHH